MEWSGACKSCKKRRLIRDDSSHVVCSSCGIVQDFDDYQTPTGGFKGSLGGTSVVVGTSGTGSSLIYRDKKIFEAGKIIDEILLVLGFSELRSIEVKQMVNRITNGEFGLGDWFPILVAACSYVVMRNINNPLSMAEVAALIRIDLFELGRMVLRVTEFLELKLPEFDVVKSLEKAIRTCPCFSRVDTHKVEVMIQQGTFLLQCAMKWFLTTGRRPLPMVAAVLAFAAELNELDICIENIAKEVHAPVVRTKMRYKELVQALLKVAKALPWGKDITPKNLMKNAPFVIQYMDMKSRSKSGEKNNGGFCLDDIVGDCLSKESEFGFKSDDISSIITSQASTRDVRNDGKSSIFDNLEQLKAANRSLLMSYSEPINGGCEVKKQKKMCGVGVYEQWWSGESQLCKKLGLEDVLEKDVGLDAEPPSFINGRLCEDRRREKIVAARKRISEVMIPGARDLKKSVGDIDWEDVIIETLLLHFVKEKEIENGNYKALLGLHVFGS